MSWPVVKLGEVAEIEMGQAPAGDSYNDEGKGLPLIAGASDFGVLFPATSRFTSAPSKITHPNDIIMCIRATIGDLNLANGVYCLGRGVCGLRPRNDRIDARFLWRVLEASAEVMRSKGRGATFLQVSKSDIASLEIPLPPLAEQKRIAAILDQAARLTRLRAEALARLDTLGQAIFHEMFGDNTSWPMVNVSDITRNARTGPFGSQLLVSEFTESGIPVLGIDNVVQNKFVWAKERYISPEKYKQLQRYQVYPGDVLVTIMGTCGRCAVVPDTVGTAINTKHICCMTPDTQKVRPRFLQSALIWSTEVLAQLGVASKGAIMPGLNMGKIANLTLRLPPIERQIAFECRLKETDAQSDLVTRSATAAQTLFASLQHRAFRGEL